MNKTEQALKPCPFCGSENVKSHFYAEGIGGEPDAFCQCHECSSTGPSGSTEEEAVAAWNRRAALQPTEQPDHVNGTVEMVQPEAAQDERERFEARYSMCDLTKVADAWSRPIYAHSHVQALWDGWQAAKRDAAQAQERLLTIIANAYQIAGAYGAPAHILDVLANPELATGTQIEAMLPFVAQERAAVTDAKVDEIVTSLYRRFKDWSKRGFGPDDVTWCEVKADVIALLSLTQSSEQKG